MKVVDEVEHVLEHLGGAAGDWAACDADGTLWAADVAELVWTAAIRERWFLPAAKDFMAECLQAAKRPSTGDPHTDASALWRLYLADEVDDWTLLKAMTACYAGYSPDDLEDRAAEVLQDALPPRTYVTTAPLIEGLRARGLQVVVITGSPAILVRAALRVVGIEDPPPVLGVEVTEHAGRLSTEFREPISWEQGKVDVWRAHAGPQARLSAAFGDSPGDLALLRAAQDARVLVQPRPVLRATAEAGPGPWWELRPGFTRDGSRVIPPTSDRILDL
ncbi:MAG: haloacid dehalogenase-like hydrolase [Planctomycetes bacterium]|nr:haloacid dehalogenase-like hydrolase [Planctomycetota bacterium]